MTPQNWEKEFDRFLFDPLVHTKDGKTWLEREQVKSFIRSLLRSQIEEIEKEINEDEWVQYPKAREFLRSYLKELKEK